jgi:hypothetical protein
VPVATPADIGAHPELADTTEIDLTAESNGEAIVDRETITAD